MDVIDPSSDMCGMPFWDPHLRLTRDLANALRPVSSTEFRRRRPA